MQEKLLTAFRKHLPCTCQLPEQLEEMLSRHLPLGLLTDLAAYALPLETDVKYQLLGECRVSVRAQNAAGASSTSRRGGRQYRQAASFSAAFQRQLARFVARWHLCIWRRSLLRAEQAPPLNGFQRLTSVSAAP